MSDYSYIPIQKELIPYQFDITLEGRTFTFFMRYNAKHDFFTIDLFRGDELIVAGEKIVYGRLLFLNQRHLDVPRINIIPYDLALNENRVTWDNLNDTVFLWIPNGGMEDV
ncbi:MAG: hypothetical protein FWC16_00805 [Defluviitaleaceae bacterium]|nr:hypothetical protein [Defluviitaleaceae bacterium]MCL2273444.1 hypothetical protein [Defluviitaleaceae bacterium]